MPAEFPHRFAQDKRPPGGGGVAICRCGDETSGWLSPSDPAPETWGDRCPAAMAEKIADQRATIDKLTAERDRLALDLVALYFLDGGGAP